MATESEQRAFSKKIHGSEDPEMAKLSKIMEEFGGKSGERIRRKI